MVSKGKFKSSMVKIKKILFVPETVPGKTEDVNEEEPKSVKPVGNKLGISQKSSKQESSEVVPYYAPNWTITDALELVQEVEKQAPENDCMKFYKRSLQLDWVEISYPLLRTPVVCKLLWNEMQTKVLRHHRILQELLNDAKLLLQHPTKTNVQVKPVKPKLSDAPELPKNELDFFFLHMKTQIQQRRPNIKSARGSKYVAALFEKLPEKKKRKYIKMAEVESKERFES